MYISRKKGGGQKVGKNYIIVNYTVVMGGGGQDVRSGTLNPGGGVNKNLSAAFSQLESCQCVMFR